MLTLTAGQGSMLIQASAGRGVLQGRSHKVVATSPHTHKVGGCGSEPTSRVSRRAGPECFCDGEATVGSACPCPSPSTATLDGSIDSPVEVRGRAVRAEEQLWALCVVRHVDHRPVGSRVRAREVETPAIPLFMISLFCTTSSVWESQYFYGMCMEEHQTTHLASKPISIQRESGK